MMWRQQETLQPDPCSGLGWRVVEKQRAELKKEAERLAGEIEELAGEAPARIG
jgi:hypothetical protein